MGLPSVRDVHVGGGRSHYPSVWPVAAPSSGGPVPAASTPQAASSAGQQRLMVCQASDAVLSVVRLDASTNACTTADCSVGAVAFGVIASKPEALQALVVSFGPVDGFTGLRPGARYFLGAQGAIYCPPLDDFCFPYVIPCGFATSPTQLFVQPGWPQVKRTAD